jgi:hypothetical protein
MHFFRLVHRLSWTVAPQLERHVISQPQTPCAMSWRRWGLK